MGADDSDRPPGHRFGTDHSPYAPDALAAVATLRAAVGIEARRG